MSLAIRPEQVGAVLLSIGWRQVADASFRLDAYEFATDAEMIHNAGDNGICATGFTFTASDGARLAGPLSAIQAVRLNPLPSTRTS